METIKGTIGRLGRMAGRWVTVCGLAAAASSFGESTNAVSEAGPTGLSMRQLESRASRMVANADALLLQRGDESRGVGMLEAVPRMFPETQARFQAYLSLGRYRLAKHQPDEALAVLRRAEGADDPERKAEALTLQAQACRQAGRAGEATVLLRRVTQDYPASAFANDAYFEIGQIHFEAGRWSRAAEAFRRVGTSVPEDSAGVSNGVVDVEAGQRLFVYVTDRDLPVLRQLGQNTTVTVRAKSGDVEDLVLEPFGADAGGARASVDTVTAPSAPHDGRLTVQGGEEVTLTYIDQMTRSGARDVPIRAVARIESSGVLTFMDGAYRQRVKGVFAGQPAFLRLRDLDLDRTAKPDTARVTVIARAPKPPSPADTPAAANASDGEQEGAWIERARITVDLVETGDHSGVFEGRVTPVLSPTNGGPVAVGVLPVGAEDRLQACYEDTLNSKGETPELRVAEVRVLVGGDTEPQSVVATASDATVQARKLLLEAQLLHKWGGIFKEVGLDRQAVAKAQEGVQRVEEIMSLAGRYGLDRTVVENAYAVKWDLELVRGDLNAAIETCRELVRRYPDTTLADLAFMRIAAAHAASKDVHDIDEGIRVYRSVLSLPGSANKAEAQFGVASALEKRAKIIARGRAPDYAEAIQAFKVCAETYHDSSFAGESYKCIVNYYIGLRDYARAKETLERVFQDYPDSSWLDEMLVRWGVVLYRMGDKAGAAAKFQRVLEEYPGGASAQQATAFLEKVQ